MLRLKSLELHGFKSFADKTKLTFPGGISCVVGPNGCGKSNIADAVSWVLGEQSAKSLRGDKMEDVIFAGSSSRKPSSFADVTMTWIRLEALSKQDEDQLIITRRLHRNGVSEYLMDGKACRLKDIQTALMDFGMGSKAYSIIEQGRIGQILNSKPTERRAIIEEAAGIMKYKIRRRESELKLRSAEDNLTRINDIINEIQKQRSHLNRQVGKARRYKHLKDEIRELDYQLLNFELVRYHDELRQLAKAYQQADKREITHNAELGKQDAAITQLRQRLIQEEQSLRAMESAYNQIINQINLFEERIKFNQAKAAERQQQLTAYASERVAYQEENNRINEKMALLQVDLQNHENKHKQGQSQLGEVQTSYKTAKQGLDQAVLSLDGVAKTIRQLADANANLNAERNQLDLRVQQLQQQSTDMNAQLHSLKEEQSSLDQHRIQQQQNNLEKDDDLSEQVKQLQELEAQLPQVTEQKRSAQEQLQQHERKCQSLKDRIEHLQAILDSRRDIADDLKQILNRCRQPVTLLRDLVDSTHTYDAALERALEGLLDSFVVKTDEEATVIQEAAQGRPYQWIDLRQYPTATAKQNTPANTIAAADLLSVDDKLAAHLRPLLADVYVCLGKQSESQTLWLEHPGLRFISEDGLIQWRSSLTQIKGNKKTLGFLSLKGELQQANKDLKGLLKQQGPLVEHQTMAQLALDQLQNDLDKLRRQRHQMEKEQLVARQKLDHLLSVKARLDARVIADQKHEQAIKQQNDQCRARIIELEGQIKNQHAELKELELKYQDGQQRLEGDREKHQRLHAELATVEAQQQALESATKRIKSELEHLQLSHTQLDARMLRGEQQKASWESDIQNALRSSDELSVQIKNAINTKSESHERLKNQEQLLAELQTQASGMENSRKAMLQIRDDVRAEQGRFELETARVSSKVAHLEEKFLSNKGQAFARNEVQTEDLIDADQFSQKKQVVDELNRKLQALGTVNLLAIEEFEEIETRYTFLVEQQKDLIDSIAEIRSAIHKLNRISIDKFKSAFEVINTQFSKIFVDLFGGGEARLELLDDSDVLESGIDMLVRPPGKKLQNALLMSGGEKALTAIALLLAVFQYRPSPFCLLDEVDAPLDDANVNRFINKIEELKGDTQFIVITHQKSTMTAASSLFGVTMENSGCSKLVSVKFD